MSEYSKYKKNVWKAECIEQVASSISYYLEDVKGDIERTEKSLKEYKQKKDEEAGGSIYEWQIDNCEMNIEKYKIKKSLWEQLLKVLDKELAF